jgi:hypothetical protein
MHIRGVFNNWKWNSIINTSDLDEGSQTSKPGEARERMVRLPLVYEFL